MQVAWVSDRQTAAVQDCVYACPCEDSCSSPCCDPRMSLTGHTHFAKRLMVYTSGISSGARVRKMLLLPPATI